MEEVELLADATVIALFGFLDALDVGGQLLLVAPGGAVDALQLLVLRVAAPVGTGNLGQLEGLEETGVGHVRATAHVHVFLVVVEAHGLLFRHVVDQAQLVFLAAGLEDFDDLGARCHLLDYVVVLVDQLRHALLDRRHVFRSEGTLEGNVVVEAFIDDRADHHLGIRIQLLDRMTDQVRARVANDFQPFLVLRGNDLQGRVVFDQVAGIDQLAVDLAGHGGLSQTGANELRHLGHTDRALEGPLTTVGKSNDGHGASSPSGDPYERPHGLGCASKRRPPGLPASQWQAPCRHPALSRADGDHWKEFGCNTRAARPETSEHGTSTRPA